MTARRWLLGLAPAFAATGALAAQPAPAGAPAAPSEAAKKIAECAGEKFEFAAGDPRPTKITLCSDKGATTADLVRMFESAAARIEQLDKLPQDRRAALVAQIKGKIIEVRARITFAGPLPAFRPPPVIRPEIGPRPEYAQLPPLPLPVRTPVVAATSRVPAVALANLRLTLECSTPGEIGEGGPCLNFARDTLLTIRAGETLPAGTSLRFLRRGDIRAEVALARMRKGQARRIMLPAELCAGVTGSNIQIQVVRSGGSPSSLGQVVDTRGPYQLRC
ncbi:MAG: hypothetical protein ACR2KH_04275 [Sphingomicrobium sp.]